MKNFLDLYHVLVKQQILLNIKREIQEVLPESTIVLFGSRANDTATSESDWDILILTKGALISKEMKQAVHDKIFPLSVSIGAFINLLLVHNNDWESNPSYYTLKKSIAANNLVL
jgi:uncharacterized protein